MRRPLLWMSLCLVALIALVYYGGESRQPSSPPDGTLVCVTGKVRDRDDKGFELRITNLTILNDAALLQQDNSNTTIYIQKDFTKEYAGDKVMCSYEGEEEPLIGMTVTIRGQIYAFSPATNPGGFDYAGYYHAMGYMGRLKEVTLISMEGRGNVMEWLYKLRRHWTNRLYQIFPQKEAGIMAAILLGEKGMADKEIRALYQRNGIVHILSVSGVKIQNLAIPLTAETRINRAFVSLHIAKIYILKLCFNEEVIPRCRFPCSRG